MKYSQWLTNYYNDNPTGSADVDYQISRIEFIESLLGDDLKSDYYDEIGDELDAFWPNQDDWNQALSDKEERQGISEMINKYFADIKEREVKAEAFIEHIFSPMFVEALQDADEVIREELIVHFSSQLKQQEQQRLIRDALKTNPMN